MAALNIAATMQALADAALRGGATTRAFGWPAAEVPVPCFVAGYPDGDFDLDASFRRGMDRADFPCWFIIGKPTERTARDAISPKLQAVKSALEADRTLGGVVQSARVAAARVEPVTMGGIEYLAIRFTVNVVS